MKARFYTLLFAILPRRWQSKLWNRLADKHGYLGRETQFGNGTFFVGTTLHDCDIYQRFSSDFSRYGAPRELVCKEKADKIDRLIDRDIRPDPNFDCGLEIYDD